MSDCLSELAVNKGRCLMSTRAVHHGSAPLDKYTCTSEEWTARLNELRMLVTVIFIT